MQPVAPHLCPGQPEPTAGEVSAFLRRHPGWLAAQPGLYEALDPPERVHGDRLADHMAAMLAAERARALRLAACAADAAMDRRAAAGLTERVQAAVLALMQAADPADCIVQEWPGLLGLDAAALCAEGHRRGARQVAPGTVDAVLGRNGAVVRAGAGEAALHGEAAPLARFEALVRVPASGPAMLLALACRDGRGLAGGAGAFGFLGQAAAAALDRA